ncbi:YcbK family protein [Phaeobacter sp. JH204B]|uniref:YcbK family protein n=1 Tax=Phaeobacter sp. JH204B TaxID=3112503 RepID=UPI003A84BA0A
MSYRDNMSSDALAAWDRLTSKYGDLGVNSAYRDPAHNARVGGAKRSQHTHGNAFDVDVSGMPREDRIALIKDARGAGFRGIGVYDNSLHFDVGPSRAWGADYSRSSLPAWAVEAAGMPAGHFPGDGHNHGSAPVAPPQNALSAPMGPQSAPMNVLAQQQPPQPPQMQQIDPRNFLTQVTPRAKLKFT